MIVIFAKNERTCLLETLKNVMLDKRDLKEKISFLKGGIRGRGRGHGDVPRWFQRFPGSTSRRGYSSWRSVPSMGL